MSLLRVLFWLDLDPDYSLFLRSLCLYIQHLGLVLVLVAHRKTETMIWSRFLVSLSIFYWPNHMYLFSIFLCMIISPCNNTINLGNAIIIVILMKNTEIICTRSYHVGVVKSAHELITYRELSPSYCFSSHHPYLLWFALRGDITYCLPSASVTWTHTFLTSFFLQSNIWY